jgi:hypothetical protein
MPSPRLSRGIRTSAWRARRSPQLHLIDPVWGGAYQYSTGGDWNEPHFEKIMSVQTEDLRLYALGYAQWRDPAILKAATDIDRFLITFLRSPEGAFYTSQDADVIDGEHSGEYFKLDDARAAGRESHASTSTGTRARTAGRAGAIAMLYAAPASGSISTKPSRRCVGCCRIAAARRRIPPRCRRRRRPLPRRHAGDGARVSGTVPGDRRPRLAARCRTGGRISGSQLSRPRCRLHQTSNAHRSCLCSRRPNATRTSWPRAS